MLAMDGSAFESILADNKWKGRERERGPDRGFEFM